MRPFIEKLITLAKQGTLHARRLAIARLHDKAAVSRLFSELGPRYEDRPGGYTRVIKRHERRLGDGGKTAFIELLKQGEHKPAKRAGPGATDCAFGTSGPRTGTAASSSCSSSRHRAARSAAGAAPETPQTPPAGQ